MRQPLSEKQLIHDWAEAGPHRPAPPGRVMLNDETLRDGLQSASVTDPPVEVKIRLLHLMESLGIETACVGLPGAGTRQKEVTPEAVSPTRQGMLRIDSLLPEFYLPQHQDVRYS